MPNYSDLSNTGVPGKEKKKTGRPPKPRDAKGNIIKDPPKPREEYKYRCCCCSREYEQLKGNFVTSSSPLFYGWDGYVPICRECLAKHYAENVLPAVGDDVARAVEVMCGICDWYWSDAIMDMTSKILKTYHERGSQIPAVILYGQRRNMTNFVKHGTTYLDTIRQRREANKYVKSIDDINKVASDDPDAVHDEVAREDVWFFGPGYTAIQYKYLREQYTDWCDRYDCQSKAQEEIFKNISIAQLNVQIAQQEGNQKKTADAIKTLQDLMGDAKIKPRQKDDAALVEQNTFGTLIQLWEKEEPIPEPKAEWLDVDRIKRYIGAFFTGHLSKVFDIDNEWSDIYDEEISKYTVTPPRYDDSAEEQGAFSDKLKSLRGAKAPDSGGGDEM